MDLLDVCIELILLLGELSLPVAEVLLLLLHNLCESLVEFHHLGLELDAVGDVVLLELGGRVSKEHAKGLDINLLLRDTGLQQSSSGKLNLLHSVVGVVLLDSGVDEIQHAMTHDNLSKPEEVAMVGVVHLGNSPGVLAATSLLSISSNDGVMAADDGKRHLGGVMGADTIILAGGVDLDIVSIDGSSNLVC